MPRCGNFEHVENTVENHVCLNLLALTANPAKTQNLDVSIQLFSSMPDFLQILSRGFRHDAPSGSSTSQLA